jgi:K+ transporter
MSSNTHGASRLGALTLAALGIVFGDIGTSPLYAFKEAFSGPHALALSPENVLATLSALLWAVLVIVSIKYVWIVLKYDNDGEGGVLALTALAHRLTHDAPRRSLLVVSAGVFAAALFYGDAIITPAISVLSAVEGISVATPKFEHFIEPITIGILIGLFLIQKKGTGSVGRLFGPITVIWFVTLAGLGLHSIAQTPMVLQAISPLYALNFTLAHPGSAFILLSAVFLALTGGEALYADMGHFGRKAVRLGWYGLVFPCLIINYFGQGALVLRDASAVANPFFLMAPQALLIPLVILATAATVIASQATISGAYSMTLQASRLADFITSPRPDVPLVAGTAVYLTSDPTIVPSALFHNLKHYKVMHRQTVFLHVLNDNAPYIHDGERLAVMELAPGAFTVSVRFGFREEPDIPAALSLLRHPTLSLEPMSTTFFVARSTIVDGPGALPTWRCALYSWMTRQAEGAATYYRLPANQVVELGTQIML